MATATQVLFVTSEIYPFSKTGGLADVLGSLPLAIRDRGIPAAVITPFYGRLRTGNYQLRLVSDDCPVGYPWPSTTAEIYQADYEGVPIYFVSRGEYFDRRYYYNTHAGDYFDNCERFNFFCRAALSWIRRQGEAPKIIHCNDWQSGLVPAYLEFMRRWDPFWRETRTVMTIHNLAFQGRFSSRLFWESGLPHEAWHMDGVEYYGDFSLLKAGIAYSDMITTVSPSYAREILGCDFGCGLEGILSHRVQRLRGILNGADYGVWDPRDDKFLPCAYGHEELSGKHRCKQMLLREFCLSDMLEDRPLLGFIGRLRDQKGIDLLIEIMSRVMDMGVGVIVLGEGDLSYEARLLELMEEYPGRLAVQVGYTEDLAHRIQAGADIFLMPSRYEPCGLTQMYALRYGTPPVATAVGGLRDTIVPHPDPRSTGFTFERSEPGQFLEAIQRAVSLFQDQGQWQAMVMRAMQENFTWDKAAEKYLEVYREAGARVQPDPSLIRA